MFYSHIRQTIYNYIITLYCSCTSPRLWNQCGRLPLLLNQVVLVPKPVSAIIYVHTPISGYPISGRRCIGKFIVPLITLYRFEVLLVTLAGSALDLDLVVWLLTHLVVSELDLDLVGRLLDLDLELVVGPGPCSVPGWTRRIRRHEIRNYR